MPYKPSPALPTVMAPKTTPTLLVTALLIMIDDSKMCGRGFFRERMNCGE
jgi:hypothetical protein